MTPLSKTCAPIESDCVGCQRASTFSPTIASGSECGSGRKWKRVHGYYPPCIRPYHAKTIVFTANSRAAALAQLENRWADDVADVAQNVDWRGGPLVPELLAERVRTALQQRPGHLNSAIRLTADDEEEDPLVKKIQDVYLWWLSQPRR